MSTTSFVVRAEIIVESEERAARVAARLTSLLGSDDLTNVTVEPLVNECEHRWRDYSEYGGDFLRGECCRDCGAFRADVEADDTRLSESTKEAS